jgi:hypothetical protein
VSPVRTALALYREDPCEKLLFLVLDALATEFERSETVVRALVDVSTLQTAVATKHGKATDPKAETLLASIKLAKRTVKP